MSELDSGHPPSDASRYVRWFALAAALLSVLPHVFALILAPAGSHYVGSQYSTDDHMVYAAWMRQAMDGRFFFDNRFAIDPQPGLTVNVYFFLLGLLARALTIPIADTAARAGFSALFIVLLGRLVKRLSLDAFATKLSLTLTTLGAGVGFVVWHTFGRDIVRPELQRVFGGVMGGHLPTDVWQPEGYVLPSMLTSSLFMVSLCLIVFVFLCILDSRESWKPVLGGALAMAALMNIHSYDVLMIALVVLALLAAALTRKQATWAWILRVGVIGAGAILPALWFLHVLSVDSVFQARAATPTFAPSFRQVVFGYLPLMALSFVAFFKRKRHAGAAVLGFMLLVGFAAGNADPDAYWMSVPIWGLAMLGAVAAVCLLADDDLVWNLLVAWAAAGTFAPYFPALFERKLAMGLSVPWAVLAALGLGALVERQTARSKWLVTALGLIVACGSSVLWVSREVELTKNNVSNTLTHPVFLSANAQEIVDYLQPSSSKHTVVLAMPGIKSPVLDLHGKERPDEFNTPFLPDLNPTLSGFAAVYTYAGHWSETPDYGHRHDDALRFFLPETPDAYRRELIRRVRPDFIVAPMPKAFPGVADVSSLGEVVVPGEQFELIKVR